MGKREIKKRALRIMKETASRLLGDRWFLSGDFEEEAYPVWRKMVHEIFVESCPCRLHGKPEYCILNLDEEEFMRLFERSPVSFKEFVSLIRGGVDLAHWQILMSATAEIRN